MAFLTAAWHDLVMLNYEIDPGVLTPLLPRGCELDVWRGTHFVSVVGFRFLRTKLLGVPVPWHREFAEVNLRFYVRRFDGGELRRGVVFVKEVVARRAVAAVARWVYNENYVTCPMTSAVVRFEDDHSIGSAVYRWKTAAGWNEVAAEVDGPPATIEAGSDEDFITEHYWGYTRQRDGGTIEYEVRHPRWNARRARTSRLQVDPDFYGAGFAAALAKPPASAFLVDGSDVAVMRGRRIA